MLLCSDATAVVAAYHIKTMTTMRKNSSPIISNNYYFLMVSLRLISASARFHMNRFSSVSFSKLLARSTSWIKSERMLAGRPRK